MKKQIRYYAAFYNGKRWVETLETHEATKWVSSVETGVTYRTNREMDDSIARKNLEWR